MSETNVPDDAWQEVRDVVRVWRELVDVLERTVRITEVPEDRIPYYKRLGQIWSQKLERERESRVEDRE